ncbi:MarR family winged helix-turn-helix transcriptional regulator [Mycobacterium sp. SMC-4]|uniref:MarR family winged helix-turn-helix transcriptional regulator n=1 Tax=Mycobacterium sp. SMC-4 TaxID=2857059 RepID=UPI0021B1B004|nr:MarR family transcriptional regulator [Mycobacterium sp. SMC-4]
MRWLTAEQQRVWRDYLLLTGRLQAAMHRQLHNDCGLSLSDYDVLVALSERGRMRISELARTLGWEQSRLSHQLRRMRDRGLVERHGDDDDRRGAWLTMSPGGTAALSAAAPAHADLVRTVMFDGLSVPQQGAFGLAIETILQRLDATQRRAPRADRTPGRTRLP